MDAIDHKQILENVKANRKLLDDCRKHSFIWPSVPLMFKLKLECSNCGGRMDALEAAQYTRGFEAAGGNPNEIIEGFR
jgi:hypothetical protein